MYDKAMLHIMKRMDAKLQDLLTAEEYNQFSEEVAKEAFLVDVKDMPDGDFKSFVLENFDLITRMASYETD